MLGTGLRTRITVFLAFWAAGCTNPPRGDAPAKNEQRTSIAASVSSQPDAGQWLMASKDYSNQRFSGLDQINTTNVQNLRPAWTFATGVLRGHEAAPLVVGDTMNFVTPFPNILYALD